VLLHEQTSPKEEEPSVPKDGDAKSFIEKCKWANPTY